MSTTGNYSGTHANNDAATADYTARAQQEVSKIAFQGGKMFGIIPVPKNMEVVARAAQTWLSHNLTSGLENAARERFGEAGATATRWGIPLLLESIPLIKCGTHWYHDMQQFNEKLKPFFAANQVNNSGVTGMFTSEEPNAIINFARNQRNRTHTNALASLGVSAGINSLYVSATLSPTVKGYFDKVNNSDISKTMQQPGVAAGGHGGTAGGAAMMDVVVGFAGDSARTYINEKLPANLKGKCSLDLCEEFIKTVDGVAKNIDPLDDYEVDTACKRAQRSVIAIFEKRFEESGWPAMSERVREDLETLSLALVRPMVSGELSPWAIINLAGQNKIIQNDGAAIANEQELKAALGEQMAKFSTDKMETLKDYYGKVSFRKQDVAHALQTLGNEEKAFLAAVLNDKVLLDGGATKEQIATFRAEGQKLFEERAGEILMMLAEQPVKELHEHFSKQEIDIIQKLGTNLSRLDRVSEGKDEAAVKALEERAELLNNRGVRRILANAYVKDASSWEKRITEKRENAKEARAAGIEDEGISGP